MVVCITMIIMLICIFQ